MRSRKLLWNTVSSLAQQVTTIVCGFILPRLILGSFGSEVNGLVTSITQFLAIIAFLEMGVGSVVKSSLYKPLANKDDETVSKIIVSAGKFFKRIAIVLVGYIVALCFLYPYFSNQEFSVFYTAGLIIAIGINSFSQYYFGLVDGLLITADQRGYIFYTSQMIAVIFNTAVCALMIHLGASIHMVKIATSLIYLLRPLVVRIYINKHYRIDKKITYTTEPIKQKWNGIAQHVAAVLLNNTGTVVLTLMATLSDVSIYSVYYLVVHGVSQIFISMTNGVQALMGEMLAKKEKQKLDHLFQWTEWSIHTGTMFVFGCTAVLVVPFVQIYTLGVNDANYMQPLFGLLLTLAHAGHCLRLPYNLMILAGGHYKQTQSNYIVAAVVNVVFSVVTVKIWGLVGVAIGTLLAMAYQTVWMAWYISKNLIEWPFKRFLKQVAVDILIFVVAYGISGFLKMNGVSYVDWVLLAVQVALVWLAVILAANAVFYRRNVQLLFKKIMHQ